MKLSNLMTVAVLASFVAMPAFALDVKKSITVAASPAATWKAIGDFCGIANWHPAVASCSFASQDKATLRVLGLNGGGTIIEKQLSRSDAKLSYSYAIVESPLPVDKYKSTISVQKAGKGAKIVWTGSFVAKGAPDDKAVEVIGGIYDGGLSALQKKLAP